jgi:large subunit ribosomal protein L10e
MAGLRKAASYSKKQVTPFTRVSKKKQKSYIKTVPQQKIVKFRMGNDKAYNQGKFPHELTMVSEESVQIRHNALEACRQFVNKKMDKALAGQYFFEVVPYPHHIQRENKMLTGAGADRMQSGMQLSYGKSAGKAAILEKGSEIFKVSVGTDKGIKLARETLKKIRSKLPCKTKIVYGKK